MKNEINKSVENPSVGTEHMEDIIEELAQAIDKVNYYRGNCEVEQIL